MVLDHRTKSVVVSIRGSASTADFVTDFMGVPEDAGPWIPDGFREARLARLPARLRLPETAARMTADPWTFHRS